jgi:serine protease Do
VDRAHQLRWQVAVRGVGKTVVLQVRRGHQPLKLKVKLEEPPPQEPAEPAVAARSSPPRKPASSRLGRALTGQDRPVLPVAPAAEEPEIDPAATPSP